GLKLGFSRFRLAARLGPDGVQVGEPTLSTSLVCRDVPLYGIALELLGFCNAETDGFIAFGSLLTRSHDAGEAPGVGTGAFAAGVGTVKADFSGSAVKAAEHGVWLLLIDQTGTPVSLSYGDATQRVVDAEGAVTQVSIAVPTALAGTFKALVLVDASVAAS